MEFHFHVHLGENITNNREDNSQQLPTHQSQRHQPFTNNFQSRQSFTQQPFRTSPNIWFSELNNSIPNQSRERFERFFNSINPLLNQFSNTERTNSFSTSSSSQTPLARSSSEQSSSSQTPLAQPSSNQSSSVQQTSPTQPQPPQSTPQTSQTPPTPQTPQTPQIPQTQPPPSAQSTSTQSSSTLPNSNSQSPQIIFQSIQDLMTNMSTENTTNVNNTNPTLTSIIRNFTDMNNNTSVPNNYSPPSEVRNEQTFNTTSNISPLASNLLQMFTNPIPNDNFQVSVALQSTETTLPNRRRNGGMSIHELNQHSDVFVNTSNDQLCSICHDTIQQQSICRRLNRCQHVFHQSCIDQWLNNNQTCPLCMQNVTHREHPISNSTSNSTTESSSQENDNTQNNNTQTNDIDLEQIMEEASEELDNDLESDNSEEDIQADGLTTLPL